MKQVNPFQVIEEQKKVIENLKYKLQFSRNKPKDIKDLNKLIHTVKCFESMLVSKYKTDAVERLLYGLIYELLMFYEVNKRDVIPLHEIIRTIHNSIDYDSRYKKNEVIGLLQSHEIIKKAKNNTLDDLKFTNFEPLLKKLITELKTSIVWSI